MLMCSAYDYYPKQIKVTWMRDGQEVTSDVISTEKLADGDWYYQFHSQLEYTPKSGEKISCMVEHASLDKPIVEYWGELSILLVLSPYHGVTLLLARQSNIILLILEVS